MLRLGELVGRPVVSQDAGAKLGEVADLLVHGERVVGIVLAGGILKSEHVLPFSAVRLLGEDTVIALSATALVGPKQWSQGSVPGQRLSSTRKKQIVTTGGQTLGVVGDVYVEASGKVAGYDVETRAFGGLVKRHAMLSADGVTAGPHALVVSKEAESVFLSKREK
jgi:uncharacterized protein YrrD